MPNSYYKFEGMLRDAVDDGSDVRLDLYVDYDTTRTPILINAEYEIDGVWKETRFSNVRE